jgi:hypothetical protein
MSADSLYDNLRSYLRISSRVVEKTGDHINVGEKFTMRFTVSNAAYASGFVGSPDIVFDRPRLFVEGTRYARPAPGDGWHVLPDVELFPGESSSVNVDFEALRDIPGIADWFQREHVARVWARADLDQNRYFAIWSYDDVHREIDPT